VASRSRATAADPGRPPSDAITTSERSCSQCGQRFGGDRHEARQPHQARDLARGSGPRRTRWQFHIQRLGPTVAGAFKRVLHGLEGRNVGRNGQRVGGGALPDFGQGAGGVVAIDQPPSPAMREEVGARSAGADGAASHVAASGEIERASVGDEITIEHQHDGVLLQTNDPPRFRENAPLSPRARARERRNFG
jgi:hypothetical protein